MDIRRYLSLLLFIGLGLGQDATFVKEYTYQVGEDDSKKDSRAKAIQRLKIQVLEEVITFTKSDINWNQTEETDNFRQNIESITEGFTKTKILDSSWDGEEYWIKAEITLNPEEIKPDCLKVLSLYTYTPPL